MVILVPIVAMSSSSHSNGFDVGFVVYRESHLLIADHTDRGFVSVPGGFLNITYNELLNFEG